MSDNTNKTDTAELTGSWAEIFTGRTGVYTTTLSLGVTLFAIDTFVVVTLLPTMVADIGGMRFYSWSFALFSVGAIIGGASSGPLTDTVGRRKAYAGAGVVFLIGVLGVSLSPTMLTLVLWRLVEGIGGGAIAAQAYGLVGHVYPPHLRGRILTVISTLWGVATVLGPGFGGIFAEFGVWRGAFWGTSICTVIFIYLAWRFVPDSEQSARLSDIPFRRLAMLAISIFLLSLTSQFESNTVRIILIFLSIAVATWAFRRDSISKIKMYPRNALALNTVVGATYWVILLTTLVTTFVNVYATLYLQVLHGVSPIVAAYIYSIMSLCWTGGALVVSPWRGRAEFAAIPIGVVLMTLGTAGLALFVVPGPIWAIAMMLGLVGTGMGFCNNPLIQRAIAAVPPEEKSIAGISVQSMRTLGISFGAATTGLIAAAAGLTHAAEPATVARAVEWVHGANIIVGLLALGAIIPMVLKARPTRPEPAE